MRNSTIEHPALLAQPGAFAREALRMARDGAAPGLFDLALPQHGLDGHTEPEAVVVRVMDRVGQAFGLDDDSQLEWHRFVAFGDWPSLDGQLMQKHRAVLPSMLLRVRTLSYFHHGHGKGRAWMDVWQRVRPLEDWVALYTHAMDLAPGLVTVLRAMEKDLLAGVRSLAGLRRHLRTEGLTAQGWRWLAQHGLPPWHFQDRVWPPTELVVELANTFARLPPELTRDAFIRPWASTLALHAIIIGTELEDRPWLVTAAWQHAVDSEDLDIFEFEEFLLGEFAQVAYWAADIGWRPDTNQRRAGWYAIGKVHWDATHPMPTDATWPTYVECVDRHGFVAVPVGTIPDLEAEGKAMRHCVLDYWPRCVDGTLLPFSVRGPGGERIATFTLQREHSSSVWRLHECKGYRNCNAMCPRIDDLIAATMLALHRD